MNETTLPAMISARIAAHGAETILRKKDRGIWKPITWAELGARARAIGMALRAEGLGTGDVAGILSEATPDWIAADLGILGAGCVSVALYPTDAGPAVAHVLRDSGCRLLFVENEEQLDKILHLRADCPDLARIVILDMKGLRSFADPMCESLDSFIARGMAADRADPPDHGEADAWERGIAAIDADALAVLSYTSGTTGPAVGVMLSHRNIMTQVVGVARMTGQTAADERLAFLPMCHVTERILGLYQALYCRTISNLVENAETVPENLQEVRPTVMIAIPRVWQKFYSRIAVASTGATWLQKAAFDAAFKLNAASHGDPGLLARLAAWLVLRPARRAVGLDRLRVAWVGGASVSPALLRWYRALGIDLREVYSLTECAGLVAAPPGSAAIANASIGSVGQSVPYGEIALAPDGEVLVRGPHVCLGYWGQPERSAASLASGWLRTGDLGRIEGGNLTLTGRTSEVLTLADGSRVSPAALENELTLSPFIADALVLGRSAGGLAALVMIEHDTVEKWAHDSNVAFTGFTSLVQAPEVSALVGQAVQQANAGAPAGQRIAAFRLIDRNLAPEDPELTPMMKLRRDVVTTRFATLIEDMTRAA